MAKKITADSPRAGETDGPVATAIATLPNDTPPDLFGDLQARERVALQAFADLAERIAAGESVPADEARGVLLACGKSAADLQARVARLKRVAALDATLVQCVAEIGKRTSLDAERAVALQAELSDWRKLERDQREAHGRYMNAIGLLDAAARKREVAVGERAALDKQLAAELAPSAAPSAVMPTAPRPHQQGGFSFQSTSFPPVAASSAPGVIW